jgi:hypothetical protein
MTALRPGATHTTLHPLRVALAALAATVCVLGNELRENGGGGGDDLGVAFGPKAVALLCHFSLSCSQPHAFSVVVFCACIA